MTSRTEMNKEKQEVIEKDQKRQKNKKRAKYLIISFIVLFILFSFTAFYTIFIATKQLIVKEEAIQDKEIPDSFVGVKIIQFSDLHYGESYQLQDLKKLIVEINKRKPDLIFFTGDLIDENYKLSTKNAEKLTNELKKLKATIGKYAVAGEEDIASFQTIMNQSEFTILNNDYDLVYNTDNNPILLIGLGSLATDRNIENGYRYFKEENHNSNIYTITLLHEPDSVDEIKNTYKTNLFLAGHSHNGQIKLPLIGGIMRLDGAKKYWDFHYSLESSDLYISGGLGTSSYPLRLFNHPSISFFRLRK